MVEGFKHTEVGEIPNDWDAAPITQVILESNGIKIGPFGSQLKKELLTKEGFKVYGQENVYDKNMEVGTRYISREHFLKLNSCEIKAGDFLISMMGTIGKCMIVPKDFEQGIMDSHLIRLRLNSSKLNSELLLHFFSSNHLQAQVKKFSVGGIMDGLSSKIVKQLQIPLPPTKAEQTAIATALNDADALITALEKLIVKKKTIKQGAMQELLKPKDGWKTKKLRKVADIFRGGSPRPIESYITTDSDGINWIKIGDVNPKAKYIFFTAERIKPSGALYSRSVKEGDFLLSNSMSFGRPYILKTSGCIHDGWLVIQNYTDTFDTDYLYYILGFESTINQYKSFAAGSTVLNLNKEIVNNVLVSYPEKNEQERIAQILSDMDLELDELEKKLVKQKHIKQGLMQVLLTGKIRLI